MLAPAPASKAPRAQVFPAGARVLVRDEEWIVRRAHQTRFGATAIEAMGLTELVRGHDAIFLSDLDEIVELRPEETALVHDPSPRYRRSRLYLETLLRRSPPTEPDLFVATAAPWTSSSISSCPPPRPCDSLARAS